MIRCDFTTEGDCHKPITLARDRSATCRVTRRVNALVLLEGGWSFWEREQSRRRTMLNSQTDSDLTQAVQQTFTDGAEQASRVAQLSTDAGERAARAGTEILVNVMSRPFRKRYSRVSSWRRD